MQWQPGEVKKDRELLEIVVEKLELWDVYSGKLF